MPDGSGRPRMAPYRYCPTCTPLLQTCRPAQPVPLLHVDVVILHLHRPPPGLSSGGSRLVLSLLVGRLLFGSFVFDLNFDPALSATPTTVTGLAAWGSRLLYRLTFDLHPSTNRQLVWPPGSTPDLQGIAYGHGRGCDICSRIANVANARYSIVRTTSGVLEPTSWVRMGPRWQTARFRPKAHSMSIYLGKITCQAWLAYTRDLT